MSDITIIKGDTYRDTLRWATTECVFVQAQLVPGAPARLVAPGHGIPDECETWVEGSRNIKADTRYELKVVDADTLELPCVNGTGFKGGAVVIRYKRPVDLTGYSARMQIRNRVGGDLLLELTSANVQGEPRILIDDAAKTIVREIPAAVTEAITWKKGVFDMEMVSGDYVIKIDAGAVTVSEEVTV